MFPQAGHRHTRIDFLTKKHPGPPQSRKREAEADKGPEITRVEHKLLRTPKQREFPGNSAYFDRRLNVYKTNEIRNPVTIQIRKSSPWEVYKKQFTLNFDEPWIVAVKQSGDSHVVGMKAANLDMVNKMKNLSGVYKEVFVTCHEIFRYENSFFLVCEYFPLSLTQLVAAPRILYIHEYLAIIGQLVHCIIFLEAQNLIHGSLSCDNILVTLKGNVRLVYCESVGFPIKESKNQNSDSRALRKIIAQFYPKLEPPFSTEFVEFHRNLPENQSATELSQHPFLRQSWSILDLLGLVEFALVSTKRWYQAGFFLILIVRKLSSLSKATFVWVQNQFCRHVTYRRILSRHQFVGPWMLSQIIVQILYYTFNIFVLTFQARSFDEIGSRAGTLIVVNMAPLLFGWHLSFLADLTGLSLSNYSCVHRLFGIGVCLLLPLYALTAIQSSNGLSLDALPNISLITGGCSLLLLLCFLVLPLRRVSYEVFLRSHQILALSCACGLWLRLGTESAFNRNCVYVSTGIFLLTTTMYAFSIIYANGLLSGKFPTLQISNAQHSFLLQITVNRRLKVHAGQYLDVWIPSISFWSFLQSHPFMIVSSFQRQDQTVLELLVEPRNGMTARLQDHINSEQQPCRVLFGGPHGREDSLHNYDRILMLASGLGIVAQISCLNHLIRDCKIVRIRPRRIHLVWQLENLADGGPAQDLLNLALLGDEGLDMITILIFFTSGHIEEDFKPRGNHGRILPPRKGRANFHAILQREIFGDDMTGKNEKTTEHLNNLVSPLKNGSKMLVTTSTDSTIRDEVLTLVRKYLDRGVRLSELEYQPSS